MNNWCDAAEIKLIEKYNNVLTKDENVKHFVL